MSDSARTIQTFSSYREARAALERLVEEDVPSEAVSISARGIRLVEQLHPKSWLYAAADGALSGAFVGLLVGFFLGLFNLSAPGFSAIVPGFWGAVIGSVAGAVTSLLVHAFRRDSERHTTERSMTAEHFDLHVRTDHIERARGILTGVDPPAAA